MCGRERKIRDQRATERTDEVKKRKGYGRQFRRKTIKEYTMENTIRKKNLAGILGEF